MVWCNPQGACGYIHSFSFLSNTPEKSSEMIQRQCVALLLPHQPICLTESAPQNWHCGVFWAVIIFLSKIHNSDSAHGAISVDVLNPM